MTLEKAIELLLKDASELTHFEMPDFREAQRLGIEAMKREKDNRDNPDYVFCGRLPGETKD